MRFWITITTFFLMSILSASVFALNQSCESNTTFHVGTGIFDITGPAAEEGMMGYGMLNQQTKGIYQRLWARAFVIESPCNGKRVVIVNADLGHIFQGIKQGVVKKLQATYGDRYGDDNVLLTATHQHSGPGGYSTYAFYNLTTLGFSRSNYDTIVNGIVEAIVRAENNIQPAIIKFAKGELNGITFNRSPKAYLLNPAHERERYGKDTDNEMSLLRIENEAHEPLAMMNWFAIHGVSMNNKNHLINGDNKGYAEYLFEKDFHSDYGPKAFIAAFLQAHSGDVSPNEFGHEGGAGLEGIKALEKAGLPQYQVAKQLFTEASEALQGGVDYRHQYIPMDEVKVLPNFSDGQPHTTCKAAIGVSMLAGTQDGEGVGKQGITCDTITKTLPHFICEQSRTACQGVKPIFLTTGNIFPYPWTPNILPLQLVKIGQLVIVAAPFELTTMTGRRLKEAVSQYYPSSHVVIAALSNAYAGYVATNEEYQSQYYEGASTHFGPWTEAALRQEFSKLAKAMASHVEVPRGPLPPDLTDNQINLQPGVVFDKVPFGSEFGDIKEDVRSFYQPGEVVKAEFWGAHPKNDYRIQGSFLAVEHWVNGHWQRIRHDWDADTEYHWERSGVASSIVTIMWHLPKDTLPGKYRLVHEGNWKSLWTRKVSPYTGYSSVFEVG